MLDAMGPNPLAVCFASCGDVPRKWVDSTTCELWALTEALALHVNSIEIFCDNDEVVIGVRRGRQYGLRASNPYCDLWSMVWAALDDIGSDGQDELVKVLP
eukprot:9703604-Karenia_brevis.AAC.1